MHEQLSQAGGPALTVDTQRYGSTEIRRHGPKVGELDKHPLPNFISSTAWTSSFLKYSVYSQMGGRAAARVQIPEVQMS